MIYFLFVDINFFPSENGWNFPAFKDAPLRHWHVSSLIWRKFRATTLCVLIFFCIFWRLTVLNHKRQSIFFRKIKDHFIIFTWRKFNFSPTYKLWYTSKIKSFLYYFSWRNIMFFLNHVLIIDALTVFSYYFEKKKLPLYIITILKLASYEILKNWENIVCMVKNIPKIKKIIKWFSGTFH